MVSVIIPSYNRAGMLPRSMNSVLAQTYRDLELIVVDDGSTDDTRGAVASVNDPRVRYVRLAKNSGACAARNAGVDAARGQYVAFHDSDDTWRPEKLARQLAYLTENGADAVCCAIMRRFAHDDQRVQAPSPSVVRAYEGRDMYHRLLLSNIVSGITIFCKAECARAIRFDEALPRWQDVDWGIRAARAYRLLYQDEVLADSDVQADSICSGFENLLVAQKLTYEKYRADIEADPEIRARWLKERATASFSASLPASGLCWQAFRASGQPSFLIKSVICALRLQGVYNRYLKRRVKRVLRGART